MRRRAALVASLPAWLVLLSGWSCGSDDAPRSGECVGGALCPDGGLVPVDAPPSDPIWAAGAPPSAGERDTPDSAGFEDLGSCFDGTDEDEDGLVDCADDDCAAVPSCRVAHGDRCEATGALTLSFDACAGAPPETCAGAPAAALGGTAFASGAALHPGGSATRDGGIVLDRVFDLRGERLELRATFGAPTCAGPCIESAGVALSSQQALETATHVRPDVGLVLGGERREVLLVVADAVAARWELAAAPETALETWRLVVRPSGEVSAERTSPGPAAGITVPFSPSPAARLALFGRNANRSAADPPGARIASLELRTAACDFPAAFGARVAERVVRRGTGAPVALSSAQGASVALVGGAELFAFVDGGRVFTGGRGAAADEIVLDHDAERPALSPGGRPYMAALADPELVASADGASALLFFTAADASGTRAIGRAVRGAGEEAFTPDPTPVIAWSTGPAEPTDTDVEMPAAAWVGDTLVVIARVQAADGSRRLVPFTSRDDGASFVRFAGSALEGLTLRPGNAGAHRFDADEIAHPSLWVRGGAFHVLYAGRRGTRWALGQLASDGLVHVRDVSGGESVLDRGPAGTFDALGPLEGDVVVRDGRAELFYVGTDGARTGLGSASRLTVPDPRGP